MTPDVVCVGILVADTIARPVDELPEPGTLGLVDEVSLHGGGCALNTASVLRRLGLEVRLVGKVGGDAFGEFVLALARERGLDARGVIVDPDAATSATMVLVDGTGERTFLHVPGANGRLSAADLDADLVYAGRALHLAGALVMPALDGEPAAALLAGARGHGLLTSMDTVWDARGRWELVEPALPHVDILTPSLAEGRAITREDDPEAVAAALRERGVRTVALTLGERGAYVAGDDFTGFVDPYAVEAVDGTGSGDAFTAGLLYGLLGGWPLERAARFANAVGALAVTAVGATEGVRSLDEALALVGA